MEPKEDLRVKVRYIEKIVTVEDKDGEKKYQEFFKKPSGEVCKPGTEDLVTRKHAIWLAEHKFIEPLKKENKQAKNRETK